jgi:uncharacterized protein (DUF2384 family)
MDNIDKMAYTANQILKALLGSDELVSRWWNSPNRAFDDQTPDDLWHTNKGRIKVYNYLLDQMEPPH